MSLVDGFLRSCDRVPRRPAVEVAGAVLTYAELASAAGSIAATLERLTPEGGVPLTGVFAARSATAFAGVLGVLLRGHGYVPLNRRFPVERTRAMLRQSGCRALVVDAESAVQLDDLLRDLAEPLLVVLPEVDDVSRLAAAWPLHRFVARGELDGATGLRPAPGHGDDVAYVIFTSGSTGVPKGVTVAHRNIESFIAWVVERYEYTEEDRLSQLSDLTFDLSVFDMFVAWQVGACICCPAAEVLFRPARFIRDAHLTSWLSVPSTAMFMQSLGMLKPARYPELRLSFFCGEPLLANIVHDWRCAAPNATVHNLYGPTELTVICNAYEWDDERSPRECDRGAVPIGDPLPGFVPLVVDEAMREVPVGGVGELLMTGPQLTLGYWRDPERTAASYVVPRGATETFYRTGDRVVRGDAQRPFLYRGRIDHQIKVLGHRVELGEVEAAIRDAAGVGAVVAVGWPPTPTGAAGLVAFVGAHGRHVDADVVRSDVAMVLPDYMVPRRIEVMDVLPLNANGKFDRRELASRLEEVPVCPLS